MSSDQLEKLNSTDIKHCRETLKTSLASFSEAEVAEGIHGYEDVMTSIGYVGVWYDGEVTSHGRVVHKFDLDDLQ